MASLLISQLDEATYARLDRDAKANRRSIEVEARDRLERSIGRDIDRERFVETLRKSMIDPGPDYEGSVALIRAIRDEE